MAREENPSRVTTWFPLEARQASINSHALQASSGMEPLYLLSYGGTAQPRPSPGQLNIFPDGRLYVALLSALLRLGTSRELLDSIGEVLYLFGYRDEILPRLGKKVHGGRYGPHRACAHTSVAVVAEKRVYRSLSVDHGNRPSGTGPGADPASSADSLVDEHHSAYQLLQTTVHTHT